MWGDASTMGTAAVIVQFIANVLLESTSSTSQYSQLLRQLAEKTKL